MGKCIEVCMEGYTENVPRVHRGYVTGVERDASRGVQRLCRQVCRGCM